MINKLKKPIVIVSVTLLVPLLNVGGWSTSEYSCVRGSSSIIRFDSWDYTKTIV